MTSSARDSAFWRRTPSGVRYIAIGAACALLSNLLLIGFSLTGVHYLIAAALITGPILIIGFLLHCSVTFEVQPTIGAFIRYSATALSSYPLWLVSLIALREGIRTPIWAASPIATGIVFLWNYAGTNWSLTGRFRVKHTKQAVAPTNPSPTRIAVVSHAVAPWHKGGCETMYREILRRLAAEKCEVHVYTLHWWDGPRDIVRDGVHYHALRRKHALYTKGRRSSVQAILFALAVLRLVKDDFDILHVDQMPLFPLYTARIVAWAKRKRMTATWSEVWGRNYWRDYLGVSLGWIGYLIESGALRLPDAITSPSSHTTRRLIAAGARNVETHPLGVDLAAIAQARRSNTESDVIFVGRLLEHKGVDLLLHAIALLKAREPGIQLMILGSGPEEAKLETLVTELGLKDNVALLGEIEHDAEVYGLMRASKVLALPSRREGFGLVVIEGNACGLPVVTLDHSDNAARDLIRPGVNGFLATDCAEDIAEKLQVALNRLSELQPTSEIGRYDWDIVAARFARFLSAAA